MQAVGVRRRYRDVESWTGQHQRWRSNAGEARGFASDLLNCMPERSADYGLFLLRCMVGRLDLRGGEIRQIDEITEGGDGSFE